MAKEPSTKPSRATRDAEREEARVHADAGAEPTPEEDKAAPTEVGDDVAEHYREMTDRGANQQGEGKLP